ELVLAMDADETCQWVTIKRRAARTLAPDGVLIVGGRFAVNAHRARRWPGAAGPRRFEQRLESDGPRIAQGIAQALRNRSGIAQGGEPPGAGNSPLEKGPGGAFQRP